MIQSPRVGMLAKRSNAARHSVNVRPSCMLPRSTDGEAQNTPLNGLPRLSNTPSLFTTCPVAHVNTAAVLAVLQPVWQRFPETSSRLRGRIEAVLDYAKVHGLRSGENPAAWRGHLSLILSKHIKAPRHHEAMAYGDVPAFLTCLRMRGSVASSALEFAILTVARGGEVIRARWSEIDADKNVWTAPLPV